MFAFIESVYNYVFKKTSVSENDDDKCNFLAEQLLNLEIECEQSQNENSISEEKQPNDVVCFQRTGSITFIDDNNSYILIDGSLYFDISSCSLKVNLNDKVVYLGYKNNNDSINVVRILENYGSFWGDEPDDNGDDNDKDNQFKVIEHVIVGEVESRTDRNVFIKDSDLNLNLDDVEATFVPIKGDWLEMKCKVKFDEDKPVDMSMKQVLHVVSFKPLRSTIKSATVTSRNEDSGTCDQIYHFSQHLLSNDVVPDIGSKVLIEAIESNQGTCTWRIIKLMILEQPISPMPITPSELNETIELENEKKIQMTHPLKFENVFLQATSRISLDIVNNSDEVYLLHKWIILSKRRDSQVTITPFINRSTKFYPQSTITFTINCQPKFLGLAKEDLVIMFKGFVLKRTIYINIVDDNAISHNASSFNGLSEKKKIKNMLQIRKNYDKPYTPGIRPIKPPAFIPVRLGSFAIPNKIWDAVLGDSDQTVCSSDFFKIVERIENYLPCLAKNLDLSNYADKWHTLLYMEEIQVNLSMRSYDMPKAFLVPCQEYLSLEVTGLSERRPSLIKGDKIIVKDSWTENSPNHEGYIHDIKGDFILLKFNPRFHESYAGTDVSVEFHASRGAFRRAHQAINLVLTNLGPDVLFPSRVMYKLPALSLETKFDEIKWFNGSLNLGQKTAITNILKGECRPMPYCIYGPPGTGKTITVIETVLQILKYFPDSRILVATPSNSASNLITERLINFKDMLGGSLVRIIANYLVDSESLPDVIKPYCATLDITRENTNKSNYSVNENGINLSCRSSFVGRQRVIIGTCYCIGTIACMGLPKGHFTHVIVDEAGQATEPEIMIPFSFIDKENGQIILAGDPMQLGPVILSKYCQEFGMFESYLSRLLETYPYQKDYSAYKDGFNHKLVTRLTDNYRSIEQVLNFSSEMFYNSSLVCKVSVNETRINKYVSIVTDVLDMKGTMGGIYIYGIRGYNTRAKDSPSWFNPHEASMVAMTTCKLYKNNVNVEDIGIITPYVAQIKYLRLLFDGMGLPLPKIGTVEEFQGQERPIILISTVRSNESDIQTDIKCSLGFVKSPKRLNVAITRAQVAAVVFCNPHLFLQDPLWGKLIIQAINGEKYLGCDLPKSLNTGKI